MEINPVKHLLTTFANPLHHSISPKLINIADGIINPQTINDQIQNFYALLYTSEGCSDETQYENFFRSLNIPSIDPETSSGLDEPFTDGEIKCVMLMQNGKCPGPEGVPANFFKVFADKLSPLPLNMFNELLQVGILPYITSGHYVS